MTKSSITGININWPHDSVHGYLQQVMKEFHYLYSVCQHPPQETGVLKYMSEVFICRGGSGSGGGGSGEKTFRQIIFENNDIFEVPNGVINNEISVFIYGAGGGGAYCTNNTYANVKECHGGGGGFMNNGTFKFSAGEKINIQVGKGDMQYAGSGGATSFGVYLSANGGSSSGYGGSGGCDSSGEQFGGGGSFSPYGGVVEGGNGGVWGGGGGGKGKGGDGGYYGGGGGTDTQYGGGNGGYYGGGGGEANDLWYGSVNSGIGGWYNDNGTWKQSGFGGNGWKSKGNKAYNGTNTIGWTNIDKFSNGSYMTGKGLAANKYFQSGTLHNGSMYGGGGGFGGCGGIGCYIDRDTVFSGGGGGYCSNGGNGAYSGGGGGGGYGGHGGNPSSHDYLYVSGGGGGYMSNGSSCGGGGGGYYRDCNGPWGEGCLVNNKGYGGGGGYFYGNLNGGGTNAYPRYPENGVCVVSFYQYL